jgi:hypothetical protein
MPRLTLHHKTEYRHARRLRWIHGAFGNSVAFEHASAEALALTPDDAAYFYLSSRRCGGISGRPARPGAKIPRRGISGAGALDGGGRSVIEIKAPQP